METKTIIVNNNMKITTVRDMGIFDWFVSKEEKVDEMKTRMTFSRNDEVSYIDELRNIEKEYNSVKKIPLWVLALLAGLVFILFTLFIVFGIAGVGNMDFYLALGIFMAPGLLFAMILGLLGLIFTRQSISFANNKANRDKIYVEKVKALKDGK